DRIARLRRSFGGARAAREPRGPPARDGRGRDQSRDRSRARDRALLDTRAFGAASVAPRATFAALVRTGDAHSAWRAFAGYGHLERRVPLTGARARDMAARRRPRALHTRWTTRSAGARGRPRLGGASARRARTARRPGGPRRARWVAPRPRPGPRGLRGRTRVGRSVAGSRGRTPSARCAAGRGGIASARVRARRFRGKPAEPSRHHGR